MGKDDRSLRFGEVVEASIEGLVGQCDQLFAPPPLGALVRAGASSSGIYGVITGSETSSLDPTRRIISRGANLDSDERVYQENPQLNRLLRTDVKIMVVGYRVNGVLNYYLAPYPSNIHTSIYLCPTEEVQEFNQFLDYLSLLAHASIKSPDDILASVIKYASQQHDSPSEFINQAARAIALILGSETQRLYEILKRLPLHR